MFRTKQNEFLFFLLQKVSFASVEKEFLNFEHNSFKFNLENKLCQKRQNVRKQIETENIILTLLFPNTAQDD